MKTTSKLIFFDIVINILALLLVCYCFFIYEVEINSKVLFMLLLSTVVSLMPVNLPKGGNISVNFAIDIAMILIFSPINEIILPGDLLNKKKPGSEAIAL